MSKRIKRCIDCKALDFGFSTNDCFPHCSTKHSDDLAQGNDQKQQEITLKEVYQENNCKDFIYERKADPECHFNVDINSEEYKQSVELSRQFLKILNKDLSEEGIRMQNPAQNKGKRYPYYEKFKK